MSARRRLRRGNLRLLVAGCGVLVVSATAGACGRLDTVLLGEWPSGLAGSGAGGIGGASASLGGGAGASSGGAAGGGGEGGDAGTRVLGLPSDADLWDGAVRLVAAASRLTVGSDGTTLALSAFRGASDQMWLFEADGENVRFVHEQSSDCLIGPGTLGSCSDAPAFRVATLRERTEERPALFEIENEEGQCLESTGASLAWGECGAQAAGFYFESSGWGRRALRPAELDVRMALIVKAVGSTAGGTVAEDIEPEHVSAVSQSFAECPRLWFQSLTDGRVTYTGQAFTSSRPTEQVSTSCGYSVPAASELSADFDELVPEGAFDGVVVYWRPGSVDGGWSCAGLGGPHGAGLGYQAYGSDAASWMSCTPEPSSAFIQAYLAMAAQYYADRGVRAPEGALSGGVDAQYEVGPFSWNHWRRDYLLGRVIRADGAYGGLGPRAFRLGPIRSGTSQ